MLSQRLGKAWLALLQQTEVARARKALEQSKALFENQLVELKGYAPNDEIRNTYLELESAWNDYRPILLAKEPSKSMAPALLKADANVLALAQKGTQQIEALSGLPEGKLVNVAGRQRMLTQRMAKFYFSATLQLNVQGANTEIAKARSEFSSALALLRDAPQATDRIREELALADGQWLFFERALNSLQNGGVTSKSLSDVFVSSENLLSVMDRLTGYYAALKT